MVYVPAYNLFPPVKAREWAERYYRRLAHTKSAQARSISSFKEFKKKMCQPLIDASARMFNPEFESRSGLSAKDILRKQEEKMLSKNAYAKYKDGLKRAYAKRQGEPAKFIKDKLPYQAADYAVKMTFGIWPLNGPLVEGGEDALSIILGWLGGSAKIVPALRAQDKLRQGGPIAITGPERLGEFKLKLRTRLARGLGFIRQSYFLKDVLKEENDLLNRTVNDYLGPEFAPFQSNGESHLDWVLHPETAGYRNDPKAMDIKWQIYEFFLGPDRMQKIAQAFSTDKITQFGPPDYMDMHLDIRVAKK